MGSILKQSTPPDTGIKRKREPSPTYGKNYPLKKDSPFSTPYRTPHIPLALMSYVPTHLPSPKPLLSATPVDPPVEDSDLRVQQVPWEGHCNDPSRHPYFSSTSRPTASPEVPRDTSSDHVPLGSHVIHPRAPSSRPMPRNPVSRPRWVQLRESPPSTPDAPDEPESSTDPRIDSAVLTEDLSILQGLLSELPMSLWSAVPDTLDGH